MRERLNMDKIPDWARQMLEAIESLIPVGELGIVDWLRLAYEHRLIDREELAKLMAVTEGPFAKAS
ncbi:MAG: hypothetical protein ACM3NH_01845 [Candidatus Saccharibacteria bacterium]